MAKQHPSFPSSQRPAGRPAPAQARSPKADYSSSTISQLGPMITLLPNKLYLRFHKGKDETVREILRHEGAFFFSSAHDKYRPYCSDFGPIDLSTVVAICRELRALLANPLLDNRPVIYYAYCNGAEQTNAAFALASYMMLVEGRTPEEAWAPFARVEPSPWIQFRDATHLQSDFDLSILDCLHGLARGREECFFSLDEMDVDEFRANDDLGVSSICPKFVAFKGPYAGPKKPSWALEPAAYMEALDSTGVTDVVRLNEASSYDACEFTEQGMVHHDLEFKDCSTPPLPIVTEFMRICNEAEGTVAVHCLAGLGRTGTLIGLWLMAQHHWKARETIGWLRIVRPGSVIGAQQHFLVAVEGALSGTPSPLFDAPADEASSNTRTSAMAAQRAEEVTQGLARRTQLSGASK